MTKNPPTVLPPYEVIPNEYSMIWGSFEATPTKLTVTDRRTLETFTFQDHEELVSLGLSKLIDAKEGAIVGRIASWLHSSFDTDTICQYACFGEQRY